MPCEYDGVCECGFDADGVEAVVEVDVGCGSEGADDGVGAVSDLVKGNGHGAPVGDVVGRVDVVALQ